MGFSMFLMGVAFSWIFSGGAKTVPRTVAIFHYVYKYSESLNNLGGAQ